MRNRFQGGWLSPHLQPQSGDQRTPRSCLPIAPTRMRAHSTCRFHVPQEVSTSRHRLVRWLQQQQWKDLISSYPWYCTFNSENGVKDLRHRLKLSPPESVETVRGKSYERLPLQQSDATGKDSEFPTGIPDSLWNGDGCAWP